MASSCRETNTRKDASGSSSLHQFPFAEPSLSNMPWVIISPMLQSELHVIVLTGKIDMYLYKRI